MRSQTEVEEDYKKVCQMLGDWTAKKASAETAMNQLLQEIAKLQVEHAEILKLQAELAKVNQPKPDNS
jgi:hypothetical protein